MTKSMKTRLTLSVYRVIFFLIIIPRESATPQRIKEAHRRILMLNHPDTGGSTYIASKINEVSHGVYMSHDDVDGQ